MTGTTKTIVGGSAAIVICLGVIAGGKWGMWDLPDAVGTALWSAVVIAVMGILGAAGVRRAQRDGGGRTIRMLLPALLLVGSASLASIGGCALFHPGPGGERPMIAAGELRLIAQWSTFIGLDQATASGDDALIVKEAGLLGASMLEGDDEVELDQARDAVLAIVEREFSDGDDWLVRQVVLDVVALAWDRLSEEATIEPSDRDRADARAVLAGMSDGAGLYVTHHAPPATRTD